MPRLRGAQATSAEVAGARKAASGHGLGQTKAPDERVVGKGEKGEVGANQQRRTPREPWGGGGGGQTEKARVGRQKPSLTVTPNPS